MTLNSYMFTSITYLSNNCRQTPKNYFPKQKTYAQRFRKLQYYKFPTNSPLSFCRFRTSKNPPNIHYPSFSMQIFPKHMSKNWKINGLNCFQCFDSSSFFGTDCIRLHGPQNPWPICVVIHGHESTSTQCREQVLEGICLAMSFPYFLR